MTVPTGNRSVPELLSDALRQLTTLVRTEIQLARAEISDKASQASVGLAMLAASAAMGIAVLVVLLLAVAAFMAAAGVSAGVAALLAAVLGAVVAAALAWTGLKRLKADALMPTRTVEQLQRDKRAAKEHIG